MFFISKYNLDLMDDKEYYFGYNIVIYTLILVLISLSNCDVNCETEEIDMNMFDFDFNAGDYGGE